MKKYKILVTGGAGRLGWVISQKLVSSGHEVCILDLKSKSTLKRIKRTRGAKILWGDITNYGDVLQSLQNVDIVIHNAFAVDPLETVPSEHAEKIDINGSENLIKGIESQK